MNTNENEYLIPDDLRPDWLVYPEGLIEMVKSERTKLVPWHLYKADGAMKTHSRFKSHLGRDLIPFAVRQDREDWACFEKGKGEAVMIIHDNTEPGWEDQENYPTFADWLREAELEAAAWIPMSEDNLRAIRKRFGLGD